MKHKNTLPLKKLQRRKINIFQTNKKVCFILLKSKIDHTHLQRTLEYYI